MKKYVFGVDVGGTTCKLGLFDICGNLLDKWEIATDIRQNGKYVLDNIQIALQVKMCEKNIVSEEVLGIGIGLPGTMDKAHCFYCPNLGWEHINAEEDLKERMTDMKVRAINDANAAALGEMWKGSAKGYQNAVIVTLGTGVGGGIIVNGDIVEGAHGVGGEIGCIVVNPEETETFIAGPKGCLEQYASATGLVNMAYRMLAEPHELSSLDMAESINAKKIFNAFKSGDVLAGNIVRTYCEILGKGLSRVSCVVDPEIYVIGGGVSKAGMVLLELVQKAFGEDVPDACGETKFALASLGNDAGIYGAAYKIIKEFK